MHHNPLLCLIPFWFLTSFPETFFFCFNVFITIYETLLVFILAIYCLNSLLLLLFLIIVWVRSLHRAQQGWLVSAPGPVESHLVEQELSRAGTAAVLAVHLDLFIIWPLRMAVLGFLIVWWLQGSQTCTAAQDPKIGVPKSWAAASKCRSSRRPFPPVTKAPPMPRGMQLYFSSQ